MIKPKQEDIGRLVIYKKGTKKEESGIITSFNDSYIFVRYNIALGDQATSQATKPEDLEWLK